MPRKAGHVPSYRRHKPSGQARVIIDGEHIYLGRYGSPESKEEYARLIAEIAVSDAAKPRSTNRHGASFDGVTVNELILRYWRFAKNYYSKNGSPTKELDCMRLALRPLRKLYGYTRGAEFGPKALKVIRQAMIDQGLCRGVINHRVSRIKRVFKWAVSEELVPGSVYHALGAVTGLRFGRTDARESEPVKPVPGEHVDAVFPYVPPLVYTQQAGPRRAATPSAPRAKAARQPRIVGGAGRQAAFGFVVQGIFHRSPLEFGS